MLSQWTVRHAWLFLVCWLAAAAALPAGGGGGLEQATDGKGSCRSKLSFKDVFMPPEAQHIWHFELTGTRNFSCFAGGLEFGPAMGVGNSTGIDGTDFDCAWYYRSAFAGIWDCPDPAGGPLLGHSELDTTVPGAVFVLPSPEGPEDDVWGRFRIKAWGRLAPANYVVRYNTSGGVRPQRCTAPPGQWDLVPFSAVVDGYLCE